MSSSPYNIQDVEANDDDTMLSREKSSKENRVEASINADTRLIIKYLIIG